ncbi:MAG: serine/threonine protein kinase, partial [Polyangiales bacterium]
MKIAIVGFDDLEEIHHSNTTLVLRGRRSSDGQRVVIKTTGDRRPSSPRIASFVRERRLIDKAQGDRVVRLLGSFEHEGAPALVLEDFGGVSLDRVSSELSLLDRLKLASDIARAIEAVHGRGVIHKDINPSNLVWNRETSTLKIVDFGLATDLTREAPSRLGGGLAEGTIRYIAPEQTGRMSCSIDRRSDLYSLGATLYELLSGTAPFEGDDPLELVHAHVARQPMPLCERDDRIPAVVSAIVMRLLEKAPERRYQTAGGVLADLERSVRDLDAAGQICSFELGGRDRSGVIEVPQTLYGRSRDVSALVDAFARAAEGGRELVLVSGSPGTGKTSLVREVYMPVAASGGDLLEGKFDQFRLGVPYAPLGHAFGRFFRRVLTLEDGGMRAWREKIAAAVG